jgi:hypothetical protein
MNEDRDSLTQWIDNERERIILFLQAFIRCKSPNPPGPSAWSTVRGCLVVA